MNTIEDRIRAAAHAAADTVPPGGVPPLRLPPEQGSRRSRSAHRGWARRLTPLAAAVAVAVVIIAVVGIGRTMHSPAGRAPATTSGPGPVVAGPPISSYVASGQVPPYYVAITSHGNPNFHSSYAVVRSTISGRTLATIQSSAADSTIVASSAAADDRTFVLDEQPWGTNVNQGFQARTFYLFRLNSSGRPGPATRLAMSVPKGEMMTGLALSPDGSKLAMAIQPDNDKHDLNLTQVRVYTLATGAVRTWTGDGGIGFGPDDARSLSWTGDGRTLAVDWVGAGPGIHVGVRLLNLNTAGSSLLTDSRQAVTTVDQSLAAGIPRPRASVIPVTASTPATLSASSGATAQPTCQQDSIITPDGSAVVCATITAINQAVVPTGLKRGAVTGFRAYSTATGKVSRTFGHWSFARVGALSAEVLWSDASGRVLIGVIPNSGDGLVGVISGNTFTPLPSAASSDNQSGTW